MAKTWILDTSTKGTGASMVPLDSVLSKPAARTERIFVPPPRTKDAPAPEPRQPRLFKVVDIVTREVLTEGVGARDALQILGGVRSIVDVNVYVSEAKSEKWRLLSFAERRLLWDARTTAEGPARTAA